MNNNKIKLLIEEQNIEKLDVKSNNDLETNNHVEISGNLEMEKEKDVNLNFNVNMNFSNEEKKSFFDLKTLKKDLSFISIFSIVLTSMIANFTIYWEVTHPKQQTVQYVPQIIDNNLYKNLNKNINDSILSLLNINKTTIYNDNSKLFFKNNFSTWQNNLKKLGLFDKIIHNSGFLSVKLNQNLFLNSTYVEHGIVHYIIQTPINLEYQDSMEKSSMRTTLLLDMIENPNQPGNFVIFDSKMNSLELIN